MIVKKSMPIVLATICILLVTSHSLANEFTDDARNIARVMRKYQAMCYYSTGGSPHNLWPSATCSPSGANPPFFPPDDYYLDTVRDADDARDLVEDVFGVFAAYFDKFINPDWDPATTDENPTESNGGLYTWNDFPDVYSYDNNITTSNYRDVLDTLEEAVKKLIICNEASLATPSEDGQEGATDPEYDDCQDAKDGAIDLFENSSSGDGPGGLETGTGKQYGSFWASLRSKPFKVTADLTDYTGSAKAYIRITDDGLQEWSNLDTCSDNLSGTLYWQLVDGNITCGGESQWESRIYADCQPDFPGGCSEGSAVRDGWKLEDGLLLITPTYDPNTDVFKDGDPSVVVYKNNDPYVVYVANSDCDGSPVGETVDGNIVPDQDYQTSTSQRIVVSLLEEYDTKAAILYINQWDGDAGEYGNQLADTDTVLCYQDLDSLKFSVTARSMAKGAEDEIIRFRATFLREDSGEVYTSETTVTLRIRPNEGDICCNEVCVLGTVAAGNASTTVYCGQRREPKIWLHDHDDGDPDNDDYEILLPDRTESYIMKIPGCGFLEGWEFDKDGNTITITNEELGSKWLYSGSGSEFNLSSKEDLNEHTLATFEYSGGVLTYQKDNYDANNKYIAYGYESGLLTSLTAYETSTDSRLYEIEYDANDRAISMSGPGGCQACGGGSIYQYEYNDSGRITKAINGSEDVVYEYTYDSETGRLTGKYLGLAGQNNPIQTLDYDDQEDGSYIVDIRDYNEPGYYRVTREYRNGGGLPTERITYEELNEDPDDPAGNSLSQAYDYTYQGNILTAKTIYPPLHAQRTSMEREYTYNSTGKLLTETWFGWDDDAEEVKEIAVSDYSYEQDDIRVSQYTDIHGGATDYTYYQNPDVQVLYKDMPEVTAGIAEPEELELTELHLSYEYEYNDRGQVETETLSSCRRDQTLCDDETIKAKTAYEYYDTGNLHIKHDFKGDPWQETEDTTYYYNGFNQRTKVEEPTGVIRGWIYDEDTGRLESEVTYDPLDQTKAYSQTSYHYDANGLVDYIKQAVNVGSFVIETGPDDWIYTSYEYDLQGNRTKVIEDDETGGLKLTTQYQYNNQNEVTKVILPNGKWTTTEYDGRGLVVQTKVGYGETTVATTKFKYDANGNLEEQTAPDGVITKYEYDDFDRVKKITKGWIG